MIRCHVYHLKQLFDISLTQTNRFIKIPTQKSNIAKNKETKALEAEIKIEKIAEEKDLFGDLVPAHMKVTYQNCL